MTDLIREQVRQQMQEQEMNRLQLAERLSINPQYLWDMLSGRRSNLPQRWQQVLDALGLEIVVRRKDQK